MPISVLTSENPGDWMSNWTKIGLLNKSKEDLNVIQWHIFLSCRVLWTVKRILWKYMWRPFERALWRKIYFTRLSLIILLLICFCFFHYHGRITHVGNLSVTVWHVFLSCRVLCTIKRILWMSMWLLFECALLKTKVLFHSFITNYFVIELFFPTIRAASSNLGNLFLIVFDSLFLNLNVQCLQFLPWLTIKNS